MNQGPAGAGHERDDDQDRQPALHRDGDGFWLPPWGSDDAASAPVEGRLDEVVVLSDPGFADTFAAGRQTLVRRPRWIVLYALTSAGFVIGAMNASTVGGALVGAVLGPVVGLTGWRLVVLPWFRSLLQSQWTFTARGVTEHRTGPVSEAPTTDVVSTWAQVGRLVVAEDRVLLVKRDGTAHALPRTAFGLTGLDAVLEWARAAGVDCSGT